jgi:hypothetical protein
MLRFAERRFGPSIQEAWEDFHFGQSNLPYDLDPVEGQIFYPYFLFHWTPGQSRRRKVGETHVGVVAKAFLLENTDRLSEMERHVLEQSVRQPLSFYEILSSEPGERIFLRDVLTGNEMQVRERSGSKTVESGDIVYAQILPLPGITMLGCCAPLRIPPRMKADVIALRKSLRLKTNRDDEILEEDLVRFADDIREVYFDIRDYLHAPPRICNTDGDPPGFPYDDVRDRVSRGSLRGAGSSGEGGG